MKEFLSIIWHKRVIVTPKKERQRVSISNVEWFSASFSRNMLYSIVIIELTASNIPGEIGRDQLFRTINKRVMLIIVLSTILIMLGSITLTSFTYLKKTPSSTPPKTPGTTHTVRTVYTHTPTSKPTAISTQTTVHAPMLSYPLFNGNTRIPEIALTFDDGPSPFYTLQVLAILRQYGIEATFFDVGYLVITVGHIQY